MAGFVESRGVEEEETAVGAKKHVSFKESVKIGKRGTQICEWNALSISRCRGCPGTCEVQPHESGPC